MFEINFNKAVNGEYFTVDKSCEFLERISKAVIINKKYRIYNIASCLDLEASSVNYLLNGKVEKTGVMYIWMWAIDGAIMVGRTWDEFDQFVKILSDGLKLSPANRLITYCHNLSYDFQFFRKHFEFDSFFARGSRTPLQVVSTVGIEFRCSYLLTNASCALVGENLRRYKVSKKVGDLDYRLIRTSDTTLSDTEMGYCLSDVLVVSAHIQECIEDEGGINRVPLTKTGYARRLCRENCLYPKVDGKIDYRGQKSFKGLMKNLTLTPEEYLLVRKSFIGGYTHANAKHVSCTRSNVVSYDFTSSYPAVMCSEKFPMSKGKRIEGSEIESKRQFEDLCAKWLCVIEIELYDLEPIFDDDYYLSESHCSIKENTVIDNGRIVSASHVKTVITNVDYDIMKANYKWSGMEICQMYIYRGDYLPRPYVATVLQLYGDKTTLKDVEGEEDRYRVAKELLNSLYGMMCTDIDQSEFVYYDDEWQLPYKGDLGEMITQYNDDKRRFTFYPWAVFITAYARRNLWTGILNLGYDYIYADTDSVKVLNVDEHKDYFDAYNRQVTAKLNAMCDHYGFSHDLVCPKTIKGKDKPLGVWDFDGAYTRFKTLGAKRYLMEYDAVNKDTGEVASKIKITIAGVSKSKGADYLKYRFKNNDAIFEGFEDGFTFPGEYTNKKGEIVGGSGKLTCRYVDEPFTGKITDYQGHVTECHERSSIHMEPADYSMGLSEEFKLYLALVNGTSEWGFKA